MDTLPDIGKNPTWSTAVETSCNVIRNDFGDGYGQRVPDGVNSVQDSVNVSWPPIILENAQVLDAFFRERAGAVAFLWTPPQKTKAQKWTCSKWTWKPAERKPGYVDFSATFKEEFDLA